MSHNPGWLKLAPTPATPSLQGGDSPVSTASCQTNTLTMRKSKSFGCFGAMRSRAKKLSSSRPASVDIREGAVTAGAVQQQALAVAGVKLVAAFDSYVRYGQSAEQQQELLEGQRKGSGLGSGRVTHEAPIYTLLAGVVPPVAS